MNFILRRPGMTGLLYAQSQVAFNDNAAKLVLIGLVQILLPPEQAGQAVSLIALLLVAPFVLFAPLSGWLADRFPKRDVLSISLWLQLAVMAGALGAVWGHFLAGAMAGFFLLGLQSALMSPARRGLVKELAGDSVGEAVGWMEMLGIGAILAGSLAGGQLIDGLAPGLGAWTAAWLSLAVLTAGCVTSIWLFRKVPVQPAAGARPFSIRDAVWGHDRLLHRLRHNPVIWRAAWGDAVFYLAGGFLMLTLTQAGREIHPDGHGAARLTGAMLALLGTGIATGSLAAARASRKTIALGLVPFGAAGMAIVLGVLVLVPTGGPVFLGSLAVLGFFGGLFVVPLGALLVDRAEENERGAILAASSMLSSLTGVAAVGLHVLTVSVLHLDLAGQFSIAALLMALTAFGSLRFLSQDSIRLVALTLARLRYDVRPLGLENLPTRGGALIVCNHVSYVDTIILSMASSRPIRFLSYDEFFRTPVLGSILKIFDAIPVSSRRAKEAILRAAECLQNGELVCVFPEGQLTRTGTLLELKSGYQLIAQRAGCPIVVAQLDGLWGSIFSFAEGRYFFKWPASRRRTARVSFAPPLSAENAQPAVVREIMLDLAATAFSQRITSHRALASKIVRALEADPQRPVLCDMIGEGQTLTGGVLLGVSWILARRWRGQSASRVGVILPPGAAGALANLALILAGKIPVNLNPTLGQDAIRDCLKQAGLETILTAEAVRAKFPRFPWPENLLLIEDELGAVTRGERLWAIAQCYVLPAALLEKRMRLAKRSSGSEAILLFTSGSSGQPKGVALTEGHLAANLCQVEETGLLRADERLLSALPLFHSFGLTMGFLFPLLTGRTLITAPSPLDSEAITEAGRRWSPSVILATPTFLRGYLKRIPRDALGTLRLALTGAERLPADLAAAFRARFGCEVLQGYGLTETSPVASFNTPNPALGLGASSMQMGWRDQSVGRLVPGLAFRLVDPDSGQPRPGASQGLLALRGANVITSYLGEVASEAFSGGWFVTGDIVKLDAEGFLAIEGRRSRFSKIGGEMVSHAAVEKALTERLGEDGADCVLGRPSVEKGEELVLLTTRSLDRNAVRHALAGALPNLWIPREVIVLAQLPVLATGKLDLAACARLVEDVSVSS